MPLLTMTPAESFFAYRKFCVDESPFCFRLSSAFFLPAYFARLAINELSTAADAPLPMLRVMVFPVLLFEVAAKSSPVSPMEVAATSKLAARVFASTAFYSSTRSG